MAEFIFRNYLKVFLVGCMAFYIPGMQFYLPQELWFQYGVMVLLGICYFVPRKRQISNVWLGTILLYAVFQTILQNFNPENRVILLNFFLGFLLIRELAERIDLNFKSIGNFLALFCALNVVWIILQLYNVDPVFNSLFPKNMIQIDAVGLMGLKSNLGTLAALSFPFIFYANPFNTIICIPLLWFGHSTAAIASVLATLFFILWFKDKRILIASVITFGVLGFLYVWKIDMPTGEFQKRFPVWFAGIKVLSGTNSIFGRGLGSWAMTGFTTFQQNGQPQMWSWAHNEFIQYLYELGIFGSILLYAYFKNLFNKLSMAVSSHILAVSILIPLLITSFIHFNWHIARFAGLSCFMIAAVEALLSVNTVYKGDKGNIYEESYFIPDSIPADMS